MTDRLPSRPSQRQVIVVMDPVEADRALVGDIRELMRQSEVAVLSSQPDHSIAGDLVKGLERRRLLQPKSVLLQSPYHRDDYQLAEEASQIFIIQKFAAFIRLCQLVGAKKVTVKSLQDKKTKEQISFDAEGRYAAVKGTAKAERRELEDLASRLSWSEEFAGTDADVEAARLFLTDLGLDGDPIMYSLVDGRSDTRNITKRRTLTIDLSEEGSRVIEAAAGLNLAVGGVKTNLKKVAEQSSRFQVTYEVAF
jgi:hypothetical protein